MSHYGLQTAVTELVRIRTFSYPSVHDVYQAHQRKKEATTLKRDRCPLCDGKVEFKWEWAHLIYDCDFEAVAKARRTHLAKAIETLRTELRRSPHFKVQDELNPFHVQDIPVHAYRKIIPVYLIGGSYNGYLTNWTMGFGHLRQTAGGFETPGWAIMAQFFSEVSPIYKAGLYENIIPTAIRQLEQCEVGLSPVEDFNQLFNTPNTPITQEALSFSPDTPEAAFTAALRWDEDWHKQLTRHRAEYKIRRKVLIEDTDSELESDAE